jgi:branched-chain amino acid transport system substrate-binding protein
VIGHYSSDVTLTAGKIYQEHQLVAVSPVSSSLQWVKPDLHSQQYMFRTASKDDTTAQALANYMFNGLKHHNAVVFYNSHSEYSQSLKSAFQDNITAKGGEIFEEFDLADPHFDAQDAVQKSRNLGAKVLVLMPNRQELDDALELMKAKEPDQVLLGGDALYGTKTLAAFQNTVAGEKNASGIVIAVPWHITANSQSNFAETSRQLWWADVSWRTALSYDATQALIAALKQNPTRQGVAETLRSESFSVDGATGEVQFLPSGDRKNQLTNPLSQLVTIEPGSRSGYGYDFVIHPFTGN